MLRKEGDPGLRVHAAHSSRSRSAEASVHLLEYLLADHTLHSHLLKQKQMLVTGQSNAHLGLGACSGKYLENTQCLLFFLKSWFELTNSLENQLTQIHEDGALLCPVVELAGKQT